MNFRIQKYQDSDKEIWNRFVDQSINATFLFNRGYMDYHQSRFRDYSLMVYVDTQLLALMPANIDRNTLYSHQGLTYGGLLLQKRIGGEKIKKLVDALISYLITQGIKTFFLKVLPRFYQQCPANSFLFFLVQNLESQYQSDLHLLIDFAKPLTIHKSKYRAFKKNTNTGFEILKTLDFAPFWNEILIPRLAIKHGVRPVHSLEEIAALGASFPKQILQYELRLQDTLLAGITIFKTKTGVKSQYGAVSKEGESMRALDFLFIHLIQKYKKEGMSFFDMGRVTQNNFGLVKQKEELGCAIYFHEYFEFKL